MNLKFNIDPERIFGSPINKISILEILELSSISDAMTYGNSLLDANVQFP